MSRQRLQLFRYKQSAKNNFKGILDCKTPDVLAELAWINKEKYPSFLEIDLTFCNRTDGVKTYKHYSRAPWEREVALMPYFDRQINADQINKIVPEAYEFQKQKKRIEKFLD